MLGMVGLRRLTTGSGLLLPLVELVRRSGDLAAWWLWIDDCLAGAVLLAAAWASRETSSRGHHALTAAWGIAAGMGYYSFAGHLFHAAERDVSGVSGWVTAIAVGAIWSIALFALVTSIVLAPPRRSGGAEWL